MLRHGSCTSRLFGLAWTSPTCSNTKRLYGHSPPRLPPVYTVSWLPLQEADRYVAIKSAIMGAFGWSHKACFSTLDSAWYDGSHPKRSWPDSLPCAAYFPLSEKVMHHKLTSPAAPCLFPAGSSPTGRLHEGIWGFRGQSAPTPPPSSSPPWSACAASVLQPQ
ncbi:hypothetical protein E2C01_008472 [Portunus trituberculatus]|uniref:Uncharacterized protein n=1 Tax=Portunus trituberculatus TaxID=210409 RepID=A0A5B7D5G1_PORTR|nr:hypothetical protein [Portunus trituberculatus]